MAGNFLSVAQRLGSTWRGRVGTARLAAILLTTTVTTAADGSFNITGDYTCPTASSLVYLTATGGNPGVGSNNSAIQMVAPLGACGNLNSSTFINVNEVTTAAAAVALGQFFNPAFGSSSTDTFGTSATNIIWIDERICNGEQPGQRWHRAGGDDGYARKRRSQHYCDSRVRKTEHDREYSGGLRELGWLGFFALPNIVRGSGADGRRCAN